MRMALVHVFETAAAAPSAPSWTDTASAWAAVVAAVAALATVVVAVIAALYAKRQVDGARAQLEEARALRREQAQPSVVVYAVPIASNPEFIDIVIKNFGTTGAHNVTLTSTPPLQQGGPDGATPEDVLLPEAWPFLAPGQEWRTFWDSARDRTAACLPDRHQVVVRFEDSHGQELTTTAVLDFALFRIRSWIVEHSASEAAGALVKIDKTLAKWATSDKVQRVAIYDGKQRDADQARLRAERNAALAAAVERQRTAASELPEQENA